MRDVWPPIFQSHEDYDPDFPGCGYPDYAKQAVVEGYWDSDTSPEENTSTPSRYINTLGPRVYHVPVLLRRNKSKPSKNENASLKQSNVSKQQQVPSRSLMLDSRKSWQTNNTSIEKFDVSKTQQQRLSSLPFKSSSHLAEPEQPRSLPQSPPVVGAFKMQVRVNAPVSLEEKRNQIHKTKKQKPDPKVQISATCSKLEELKIKIEEFAGTSNKQREYRFLDEMLTRLLLELDDVETEDYPDLRKERRKVVKEIHLCVARLEQRLVENQAIQTEDVGS